MFRLVRTLFDGSVEEPGRGVTRSTVRRCGTDGAGRARSSFSQVSGRLRGAI